MDFVVSRQDLRQCRFVETEAADRLALGSGAALLRIESFAFTANNVTYAVVGDLMSYWQFFPAAAGWGRIPVWGIGVVERSRHDDVAEGERVYGYFPMSTHLVVEAVPTPLGFVDGAAHRQALPAIYNHYAVLTREPGYTPADDDRLMLFRPLFATAFLLDDFLADADFFGARTVVLASASSKTAFSLAFLLARNRAECEVIGLTSAAHVPFVERLGCYDRVVTYDAISSLPAARPVVFVDMAGNLDVTRAVHRHFGADLKHSAMVGLAHWEKSRGTPDAAPDLPGATPQFFFAPTQFDKRLQDWGPEELQRRLAAAWRAFLAETAGWIRVVHGRGPATVEQVYRDTLDGRVPPDVGHVLSLWERDATGGSS